MTGVGADSAALSRMAGGAEGNMVDRGAAAGDRSARMAVGAAACAGEAVRGAGAATRAAVVAIGRLPPGGRGRRRAAQRANSSGLAVFTLDSRVDVVGQDDPAILESQQRGVQHRVTDLRTG